jgi:hypothetical protein
MEAAFRGGLNQVGYVRGPKRCYGVPVGFSATVARLTTKIVRYANKAAGTFRFIRSIILCDSHGALFSISRRLPHRGYRLVLEI